MDFLNDTAPRRILQATEGKKPISRKVVDHVYLITSAAFFCKRDKRMEPKQEFSEDVMKVLQANHAEKTFLLCLDTTHEEWMRKDLEKCGDLDLRIFTVVPAEAGATTVRLRELLKELGVRMRPMRNVRAVSYLNIQKFVLDNLTTVGASDYEILGIDPDKDVTFQDMVKKRSKTGWLE